MSKEFRLLESPLENHYYNKSAFLFILINPEAYTSPSSNLEIWRCSSRFLKHQIKGTSLVRISSETVKT